MKRYLGLILVAVPLFVQATPVCTGMNPVPQVDSGPIPTGTWRAAGFECEQQDKWFSNFSTTGAVPSGTTLRVSFTQLGGMDFHTIQLIGSLRSDFTLQYNVAVTDPSRFIIGASAGLDSPFPVGKPTNAVRIVGDSGSSVATRVTQGEFFDLGSPLSLATVFVTFKAGGGEAKSISSTIAEFSVPEPLPVALCGAGLVGLTLIRRKRV